MSDSKQGFLGTASAAFFGSLIAGIVIAVGAKYYISQKIDDIMPSFGGGLLGLGGDNGDGGGMADMFDDMGIDSSSNMDADFESGSSFLSDDEDE